MTSITLETIGLKALIYCQTAERARLLSSQTGQAMNFTEEQAKHADIMATVLEQELFELCEIYHQERRNARDSET